MVIHIPVRCAVSLATATDRAQGRCVSSTRKAGMGQAAGEVGGYTIKWVNRLGVLPCRVGKGLAKTQTCCRLQGTSRLHQTSERTLDRTALEQLKYRTVAGDRHPCPAGQSGLPQQSCSMWHRRRASGYVPPQDEKRCGLT